MWKKYGDPTARKYREYVPGMGGQVERKEFLIKYKLEHGCTDCGYNEHHAALSFDHLPGTDKVGDIKSGASFGWARLLEEIDKCEVVCMNCHQIRTYNRNQD